MSGRRQICPRCKQAYRHVPVLCLTCDVPLEDETTVAPTNLQACKEALDAQRFRTTGIDAASLTAPADGKDRGAHPLAESGEQRDAAITPGRASVLSGASPAAPAPAEEVDAETKRKGLRMISMVPVETMVLREIGRVSRESEWNETRWREAATRASTECGRRQWLEDEIGKLRAWMGSYLPDNGFDECLQADVQRRIAAILAGPPPKTEESDERK